ncbi:MAG: hypothetical protein A2W25_07710 [candidate division Zixibacteria bacterium RBG_16_53_22]|nr:MAG: hypothetical protein A2W25_07710 [candidate division Zixibacteria bacterium RBG_16_53_22]
MKLFTTRNFRRDPLFLLLVLALFAASCETDVKELTIRVRSRMHLNFREDHKVKMYEKFALSDTDLEAVVVEFIPDFAIDTLTHKVITKSDTLNNPAAKILIIQGGEKKEEVWAFRPGMLPHFSPKSFIGFELLDIETAGKYKQPIKENSSEEK